MKRKYIDGEIVIAMGFQMIVIAAILCVKGWRYELGFPKKDGTIDKRRETRFCFEELIKKNK